MSNTLRYPEEFGADGPVVDYLRMDFVRRDYEKPDRSYKKADGFDPIYINIPQKVTEAISQQFNQSGLGTTGEFFGKPTVQGGNAFLSSARRLIENFALDKSVDIANKLGATNLSAAGLLSASSGVVFNPNLEVLYEGPDFRKFNFQFNLFTKSETDAEQIYKIVERLRLASLPSTNAATSKINAGQLSGVFQDASQGILAVAAGQGAGGAVSGLFQYFTKSGGSGNSGKTKNWWQQTQGASKSTAAGAAQAAIPSAGDAAALAGVSTLLGSQTGLFGAGASGSRFITQPPFIMLTYMRGAKEHPFLMPLLPAAIDQINFDFTPTGNYTVVGDFNHNKKATTVGVTITMSLTEVTNLFQETAKKMTADNSFAERSPKYSPF